METPSYAIDGPVIFLDVDGVIATPKQIHAYAQTHGGHCPPGPAQIDMECMKRLKLICVRTTAMVVLSSTWRKIDHDLADLMKACSLFSIPVVGMTPVIPYGERGAEIQQFCTEHDIYRSMIVVLDDDGADLTKVKDRLIRTDGYSGLSDADVETACRLIGERQLKQ